MKNLGKKEIYLYIIKNKMSGTLLFPYLDLYKATATYDKFSNKMYVNVVWSTWLYLNPDDTVVLTNGKNTVIFLVKTIEKNGNENILTMQPFDVVYPILWNDTPVLIKKIELPIFLVKPSADISLAIPGNTINSQLQVLKDQIAIRKLPFTDAIDLLQASSSEVSIIFNSGNPVTLFETMIANKVKATISKKGVELISQKTNCRVITSGQPAEEYLFLDYVRGIRHAVRSVDMSDQFYFLSVLDENLVLLVHRIKIMGVRRLKCLKQEGGCGKTIIVLERWLGDEERFFGNCTFIIEKQTVKKSDYAQWYGELIAQAFHPFSSKESGAYRVNYIKKYSDSGDVYLELHDFPKVLLTHSQFITLTIGQMKFFGTIRLAQDNKVRFVLPSNSVRTIWAKKMAAIQYHGTAYFNSIEVGSSAKPEALTLKVEFNTYLELIEPFKELQLQLQSQATPFTIPGILGAFGELAVIGAVIASAELGTTVLNAAVTFAKENIQIFNSFFEIRLDAQSFGNFGKMTVCDGVGTFRDMHADIFLDATVTDIKKMHEQEATNLVNSPFSNDLFLRWKANITSILQDEILGEHVMRLRDAEIKKTEHDIIYRFYYESAAPLQRRWEQAEYFRVHITKK